MQMKISPPPPPPVVCEEGRKRHFPLRAAENGPLLFYIFPRLYRWQIVEGGHLLRNDVEVYLPGVGGTPSRGVTSTFDDPPGCYTSDADIARR
ncbi:Hypothetical protein NTJ_06776 [Nesidiocoris tenuis]|uniref:Uncharacterized protein n=1 Tax=Nesidiocoris tenuis TaxID=355587 RepID=A0ABN7AP20_9HEMI|nr:Hypothetical protein NTJ_06776 [Nesidiocoris tenuis]